MIRIIPGNTKIYDLNAGKSLPQWLSARKRRKLVKKDVDIRRRIELIQDFSMPDLSTSIRVSNDGQYIFATGIYPPRLKCFDVNNLSLKFERCFDDEIVTFEVLSDDFSKLIFLQSDRSIIFHSRGGKYYKLRVPRYGRDLKYHYPSCDTFVVGTGKEIYRINLERGQFLQSYETEATSINKCEINPLHHLLVVGTEEGKIEAWDPRMRNRVGMLECALHSVTQEKLETIPEVTALKFQGGLNMAVGMSTGHILLYDIRSSKPFVVRDHMYRYPIKNIEFHEKMDLVYSMDKKIVKIWEKNTGKPYASIESKDDFNDLCVVPNTGLLLMTNESPKIKAYYVPSLGPAPYWCSFLDNLIEELEEMNNSSIYDDYKFVTDAQLNELGLSHLKGSKVLKAHMHGYFMDIQLYRKTKDVMKPFEFEEHKKKQIQEKPKESYVNKIQKSSNVNQELVLTENSNNKNKQESSSLIKDERFKALFNNSDFEIDKNSGEYGLVNPVISHLDKSKTKQLKRKLTQKEEEEEENEDETQDNNSDESFMNDTSDSDDEKPWVKEVQKNYRLMKKHEREKEQEENSGDEDNNPAAMNRPKSNEIRNKVRFEEGKSMMNRMNKIPLGERVKMLEAQNTQVTGSRGSREMTFTIGEKKRPVIASRHQKEHKRLLRPASNIFKKRR